MVGTIRKPTDLLGATSGGPNSTQLVMSGKKNAQQSNNGNYLSPYSQKMAVNGKLMH